MPKSKTRARKKSAKPRSSQSVAPARKQPSPRWYVITMFSLMGSGVLLALISHVFPFFRGWGMWVGLTALAGGFLMTTNYR